MRRNASLRPNKQVFLAIWVALGFTVLVLASIAWKRSSAAVIKVSTILHTLGPESPAGPSSLVDLHAEIGFLKQERFQARQQRDTAQTQAQQLQDQLNAVNKQLEDSLSSQQNSTTSLENVSGDRHVPWAPSLSRDQQSSNPELAAILRKIAIKDEVAVAVSNGRLAADNYMLQAWCEHMQKAGVTNHMVVALDDFTKRQVEKWGSVAVHVQLSGQEEEEALKQGSNHAVSGLKFQILQEFLLLGYSVLLSDVDIVTIRNPFDYVVRDSDVEGMTDGWDDPKAYGYNDVFDDPQMHWSRFSHSMRVSVINSGLFYMRPTQASLDVLKTVFHRIKVEHGWDQALFNEVIFFPSRPGYSSPCPTRRIMDRFLFMNSKTLFVYLRKDEVAYQRVKPAMVHVNYHSDKWPRFQAVSKKYVDGIENALDEFTDASP